MTGQPVPRQPRHRPCSAPGRPHLFQLGPPAITRLAPRRMAKGCPKHMPPHPETWLRVTPQGLYCEPGDFYIDPVRPVDRAVITHGHADHARPGHRAVLATAETLAIMRARMGEGNAGLSQQALAWHEPMTLGDVKVWLSP